MPLPVDAFVGGCLGTPCQRPRLIVVPFLHTPSLSLHDLANFCIAFFEVDDVLWGTQGLYQIAGGLLSLSLSLFPLCWLSKLKRFGQGCVYVCAVCISCAVPSSVSSWRLQAIITSLNAPVANKKPIQEAKF